MTKTKLSAISGALLAASMLCSQANATTIALDYDPAQFADAKGQQALAGFQEAASFWESMFTDEITVNLSIAFDSLGAGILGSTGSTGIQWTYQGFANALINDATSALDNVAVSNFSCDTSQPAEANGAAPCALRFLDTEESNGNVDELDEDGSKDNYWITSNTATAKAMGLDLGALGLQSDGNVTFSSDFAFDFDSSDGIDSDKWDFVGVAIHEIGHALGFTSGVDTYDYVYNFLDPQVDVDNFAIADILDLFRYSEESYAIGWGVKDFRPGADSYFSLDGGATNLADFSTGHYATECIDGQGNTHFCGQQASHWKDHQGTGIMDPTAAPGEILRLTAMDLFAFDAIGWDIRTAAVPEPTTVAIFGLALAGLASSRRRTLKAK